MGKRNARTIVRGLYRENVIRILVGVTLMALLTTGALIFLIPTQPVKSRDPLLKRAQTYVKLPHKRSSGVVYTSTQKEGDRLRITARTIEQIGKNAVLMDHLKGTRLSSTDFKTLQGDHGRFNNKKERLDVWGHVSLKSPLYTLFTQKLIMNIKQNIWTSPTHVTGHGLRSTFSAEGLRSDEQHTHLYGHTRVIFKDSP